MKPLPAFFAFALAYSALLTRCSAQAQPDEPRSGTALTADHSAGDRVSLVRKTYRDVPPDVLGLASPVRIVYADFLFDGKRSTFVIIEDARGKKVNAILSNDGAGSELYRTQPFRIGDGAVVDRGPPALIRGPEEAAIYGILIRWNDQRDLEDETTFLLKGIAANAGLLLEALDDRYSLKHGEPVANGTRKAAEESR